MPASFPATLPSFTSRAAGDTIIAGFFNDIHAEVEALAAKVGADSSAVETSIDYLLRHLPGQLSTLFVNDTANANMTMGITINQGAADDEAFALKSSDVAHGITDVAETDTYLRVIKHTAASGGVVISGLTEATTGFDIQGIGVADDTTKSTNAIGAVNIDGYKKNGTSAGACGTDANLVVIRNASVARFIFDAEGSGHADVEWTTYSDGRVKQDIEGIPYGLDAVLAMQPKRYTKYSGRIENGVAVMEEGSGVVQLGFIAQELAEIVPEAVGIPADPDSSLYSVNYDRIGPVLVKAIQELNAKVEALRG